MSVSAISNSNSTNNQINLQYRVSNLQFRQLGQDLASGNLSAAKSDFAILEQALTQSTSSPSPASNPMMQAFQQLATDLKAGDLSAAKQDFLGLQVDLQNSSTGLRFHHNHRIGTISGGNLLTDSSNAAAQQAYGALQQLIGGNTTESDGASSANRRAPEPPIERRQISFVA